MFWWRFTSFWVRQSSDRDSTTARRASADNHTEDVVDSLPHTHYLCSRPAGVSRGERGGAALQVIGPASAQCAAADGDGVDAAGVAVAGAVVSSLPSVPRGPNENRTPPVSALRLIEEKQTEVIHLLMTFTRR